MRKSALLPLTKAVSLFAMLMGTCAGAGATIIESGWDLFETPVGSSYVTPIPGGPPVALRGVAFGPGDTDTVIRRTAPTPIPAGATGSFNIELVALFLRSVTPIDFGGGILGDLYVAINKLGLAGIPQPDPLPPSTGVATITSHNDSSGSGGGGTFDSFFDVWAELIITVPGSDPNDPANWLTPPRIFSDRFQQNGGVWSHTPRLDDPHNATYPAGYFYPGVDPVTLGKVLTVEQALLAQHGVFPGQIPEPGSCAMLLAGLGLLGFMARRRRQNAV